MYNLTRGERNNNPCNIRKSGSVWDGKIIPGFDANFEQFDTTIDGIRAGAKILLTYYKRYGLSRVIDIITRWAPSSDNNPTEIYAQNVADELKVNVDDRINPSDPVILEGLMKGIINQENGRINYSDDDIMTAVKEAIG